MPVSLLRLGGWLRRRAEDVSVLLLATMFLAFIVQIVARYCFNRPLSWTSEVSTLTWLWVILWTAAFVTRESEEVRFDIIYAKVAERTRRVFTVITGLVLVGLLVVSFPASWSYVRFMAVERSAALRIPFSLLFSIFIIFSAALIVRYAWLVWRAVRGDQSPMTDPAKA